MRKWRRKIFVNSNFCEIEKSQCLEPFINIKKGLCLLINCMSYLVIWPDNLADSQQLSLFVRTIIVKLFILAQILIIIKLKVKHRIVLLLVFYAYFLTFNHFNYFSLITVSVVTIVNWLMLRCKLCPQILHHQWSSIKYYYYM